MPPVRFEPTISAGERLQTNALDRAAIGTGTTTTITTTTTTTATTTTTTTTNNNNNNNNNSIPVIIGANGTISKSLRQYLSNISGKHEIKEMQKTAILCTAHILREVPM